MAQRTTFGSRIAKLFGWISTAAIFAGIVHYDRQQPQPSPEPELARIESRLEDFKTDFDTSQRALLQKSDEVTYMVNRKVDLSFAQLTMAERMERKQDKEQVLAAINAMNQPVPAVHKPPPSWLTPEMQRVVDAVKNDPNQFACLAYLAYQEARGEGEAGVKQAILVTLNRIRSQQFGGDTACKVAYAKGQYEGVKVWVARWHPKEEDAYLLCAKWISEVLDGEYYPPPSLAAPDVYWYMQPKDSSLRGKCEQYRDTFLAGWVNHHRFGRAIHNDVERQEVMNLLPSECSPGHGHVRLMARAHGHHHHRHHAPAVAKNKQPSWWSKLFSSKPVQTAQK